MLIQFKGNDDFSHTYLVWRFAQCVLIDPSHDLEKIQEKLVDKTLIAVILTHAHSDHVHLIGYFDCPIYIHQDDAQLLFEDQYNGYTQGLKRPYKRKDLDLIITDGSDKIKLGEKNIILYHTPGHTKGGLSVFYDDMIFTGDTLFKGDVGRHDLYSGNLFELKKSILYIIDHFGSDTKVYPGHDEPSTIRSERKNNPYYLKWAKQLKK